MRAVESFDPARKTRFSTYASNWIKQKIKRAILHTSKTVREPPWFQAFRKKWNSAIHALTTPDGLLPTEKQVQTYLNVSDKFIQTHRRMLFQCTTHENEYPSNDESGETEFESLLPGIREDPSLPAQHRDEIDILDKALHFLGTKEKIKILEHFGLHETNSPSLDAETPLAIAMLHEALLSLDARESIPCRDRSSHEARGRSDR
jgi:RNA polymerase primary sigma factor